ncbi:MAG: hypothetical protein KGL39_20355 [Patescibacteria group bacterium]|nr:hypothetical protein [Patescibacteria group bacterium]
MSFAPQKGDAQVSLSVFGGLVTEMSPSDLPKGVSPDCQDMVFAPGNAQSRPALQKVFAAAFPAGGPLNLVPTLTYAKGYVTPLGGIYNLYLDSNGMLWYEDVINNPGVRVLQGSVTAGSWMKSITAFGREYLAPSDGLHGTDIPLQFAFDQNGNPYLDRVTQDGPGAPPNVASVPLASVNMAVAGSTVLNLTESDPTGLVNGIYTSINTWTANSVAGINPGDAITIAGYTGAAAPMNGIWTVLAVFTGGAGGYANLLQLSANLPGTTTFSTAAATGTVGTGTMSRQGNIVTVNTAAAHNLKVGYQAQIAAIAASAVGGGIASIVIANENAPGIATITTNSAHGLLPGIYVSIAGVAGTAVGGGIASIGFQGGVVTVTTNSAHGLYPGAIVNISGTGTNLDTTAAAVQQVTSATVFTYFYDYPTNVSESGSGTVTLNWPIPDTPTPTYFEVLSCPTSTTFQVSINYSDGTWNSGTVSYAWDGTFFVTAVPSATSFQYQQYGPNASTNTIGTVTPYGQAAPGIHLCRVTFLTRNGAITRSSPFVQFVAAGGQYLSVTNIPIGPPNVVARILEFTGASGSSFCYLGAPPQVNGQIVGTATQINDNTTTAVLLDFSDASLFGAAGDGGATSVPGNNLAAQIVLDGALGFGLYGSRLMAWGMRNRIQNLLNMGFDGGQFYNASGGGASNLPCGWTAGNSGAGGALANGHWGWGWQASGAGSIFQSFYQDAYGAPIGTPNTKYALRAWVSGAGTSLIATISSASTGFSASATVNGVTGGAFAQANFSAATPSPIPPDMRLTLTWTGTPLIDELSIIYQQTPYLDQVLFGSYVDNPEGFDGVTGKFGSSQDTHKVMDIADIRQTLYILTQDPGGRLHETNDNGVTEPAGWSVDQVAANCGLFSAFGLTKSQADDSSAAGGEEWFAWASASGARIFGGQEPWKISQEIEPDWESISAAYRTACWALNDPVARVIYFGLPINGVSAGAATKIYPVNYRGLNSAYDIGQTGPIRIGFTGKLVATDHSRKWTRWNLQINGAALMYRAAGQLQPVLLAGNGQAPGAAAGFGNVYILNAAKYTDDDYGQILPYYTTYFAPDTDEELALQLSGLRKLLVWVQAFVPGIGTLTITPLCDSLSNAWSVTGSRTLAANPTYDLEWAGGQAQAQRIAIKFASSPAQGQTDNSFSLQKVTAWLRMIAHLRVRGAA